MLHAAEGTDLHMPLLLALGTGMRRSELLGLRWDDVDLEAGTATVNQGLQEAGGQLIVTAPKTVKSRRAVTLPGLVVDALRVHRAEQARKTLAHEPNWTDSDVRACCAARRSMAAIELRPRVAALQDQAGAGDPLP